MNEIRHTVVADGVRVTSIRVDRFKKDRLSVCLLLPLSADTAAENALLTRVLTYASAAYPDPYSLNRKLDSLYGAVLSTRVSKMGEIHVLRFTLTAIKGRFTIDGTDMSAECVSFLLGTLLSPVLDGTAFRERYVAVQRRSLIDDVKSLVNDKSAYAARRMTEEMCKNEAFGVADTGTVERISAVTHASLYDAWQRVIRTARVEVFAVGEMDMPAVCAAVTAAFSSVDRAPVPVPATDVRKTVTAVRRVTEEMDVEQGKLVMGFRSGLAVPDDTLPLVYANTIFGASATSKLFLVVREQMHLCYSCHSRPENFKGLLTVHAGIDPADASRAETAILEQLQRVKEGDFTVDDMAAARAVLRNAYRAVADDPASLESWYFDGLLRGRDSSPEELADKLDSYTKDDLTAAFAGVTLDTVYLLRGFSGKEGTK